MHNMSPALRLQYKNFRHLDLLDWLRDVYADWYFDNIDSVTDLVPYPQLNMMNFLPRMSDDLISLIANKKPNQPETDKSPSQPELEISPQQPEPDTQPCTQYALNATTRHTRSISKTGSWTQVQPPT